MRKIYNILFIKIWILISIVTMLVACEPGYAAPMPAPPRGISKATLPFQEKWRASNLLISRISPPKLYVYNDYLFYVTYKPDGRTHWLEVLDAKSGLLLWKTQNLPFVENAIVATQDNLYLLLAGKFLAYDLVTGDLLWETNEPLLGHTSYWAYPTNDTLLVFSEEDVSLTRREQIIRSYDLQTGSRKNIERIEIPQNDSFILKTPSNDYWVNGNILWAINNETNQRQWLTEIGSSLEHQPVLSDSILILADGIFSEVIGIDNLTGNQVWTYEGKIVSNLAVTTGIVYVIRTDAAVVGIDAITGKELGYIAVEPNVTEADVRSLTYLVAATENMIYAYYGDSQELIAFTK